MDDGKLTARLYSPAARVPASRALPLVVTRRADDRTLVLETANGGKALLELGPQQGTILFAYGKSRIVSAGHTEGVAFVNAAHVQPATHSLSAAQARLHRGTPDGPVRTHTPPAQSAWDAHSVPTAAEVVASWPESDAVDASSTTSTSPPQPATTATSAHALR